MGALQIGSTARPTARRGAAGRGGTGGMTKERVGLGLVPRLRRSDYLRD